MTLPPIRSNEYQECACPSRCIRGNGIGMPPGMRSAEAGRRMPKALRPVRGPASESGRAGYSRADPLIGRYVDTMCLNPAQPLPAAGPLPSGRPRAFLGRPNRRAPRRATGGGAATRPTPPGSHSPPRGAPPATRPTPGPRPRPRGAGRLVERPSRPRLRRRGTRGAAAGRTGPVRSGGARDAPRVRLGVASFGMRPRPPPPATPRPRGRVRPRPGAAAAARPDDAHVQ